MAERVDLASLREEGLVVDRSRHYTYADVEPLGETLTPRYEIIDGVLYVSPTPHALWHQSTIGQLMSSLWKWLEQNCVGRLFLGPVDVVLAEDCNVVPDLVFIRSEHLDRVRRRHFGFGYAGTVPNSPEPTWKSGHCFGCVRGQVFRRLFRRDPQKEND